MNKKHEQEQQRILDHQNSFQSPKEILQSSNSVQFGSNPLSIKCPFCLQNVQSQIIAKPQLASILLALFLFSLFPNFFTLLIVAFLLQFTATKKHRCPLCEMELGTDGKFLGFFTDQIYSFSIAGTGLILSKKIIASALIILLTFLIIFVKLKFFSPQAQWTELSWDQLRLKCSEDIVNTKCMSELQLKTVRNWHGFVMKIEDNRESLKRYYSDAVSIYVKMQPSQHDERYPDLMIFANSQTVYQANQIFNQLKHGDQIVFNATFKSMKRRQGVKSERHFNLVGIQRTGKNNPNVVVYINQAQLQWFNEHVVKHSSAQLRRQSPPDSKLQNKRQDNGQSLENQATQKHKI